MIALNVFHLLDERKYRKKDTLQQNKTGCCENNRKFESYATLSRYVQYSEGNLITEECIPWFSDYRISEMHVNASDPSLHFLYPLLGLEPIPAVIEREAGYTLDRPPEEEIDALEDVE